MLCVAVLCLYRGGPVMCCALTVNRLLVTVIIIVWPQSAPSQISTRREHLLPKLKNKQKTKHTLIQLCYYYVVSTQNTKLENAFFVSTLR